MPSWGIIPDKPGWYWVRGKGFGPAPVKVFESKAGGMLCCVLPGGAKMACEFHKFEWAGPLTPPVD